LRKSFNIFFENKKKIELFSEELVEEENQLVNVEK